MSSPSPTDWITAVGTIVAAVAAIATAVVAWIAARTWKAALRNQRDDECVAAAINLQSAIHRCISAIRRKRENEIWPAYDDAWNYQSRFRSAYEVARRYHSHQLPANMPDDIDKLFDQLKAVAKGEASWAQVNEVAGALRAIVDNIRNKIGVA